MFATLLTPTKLLWLLRQLLQFGGIWLAMNGHASTDDVNQALGFFDQLLQPTGAVAFLVGFGFNVMASFRTKVVAGGESVGVGVIRETVGAMAAREVVSTAKETIAQKPTLWESWFPRRN